MSQLVDRTFIVIKFVGLPEVFSQFYYKCIHRSLIVTRDGKYVFVACSLQDASSLCIHHMKVSEVYSATIEYETDDVDDGLRFVQKRLGEYMQKSSPAKSKKVTSALQYMLEVLPQK